MNWSWFEYLSISPKESGIFINLLNKDIKEYNDKMNKS